MKFALADDVSPELRAAFAAVEQLSDRDAVLLGYAIVGAGIAQGAKSLEEIPGLADAFKRGATALAVGYWLGLQTQQATFIAQQAIEKAMQR